MLRYSTLYRLYPVIFACQREPRYARMIIAFAKLFMTKYSMQALFFIIITLCFSTANSLENTPQTSATVTETTNVSAQELLRLAKSLRSSDRQRSIQLANESLRKSQDNNNPRLSAQSHHLLGKLARESKHINQSMEHLLQASLIYKSINDKENQIKSSMDYVKLLLLEKRYDEVDKIIDELLPIAQKFGAELPLALMFTAKGDSYYHRKRYYDAIAQYTHVLKYFSETDKPIPKQLGITYKKIAQSYKHLRNRMKSAYFLKKSLYVHTALEDLKSMASILNALSEAERYLGDYEIALDYSTRSLNIYKQINVPIGRSKALVGAGIIYRQTGYYQKSLTYIHEAYLYYKKVNNANGIAKTSNQIGLIYSRLKQFKQARTFYQITIDLPVNKVEPTTIASALREIAIIDLDAGHYGVAIAMAKKAHKIYQKENDKSKQALSALIIGNIYRAQKSDTQAIDYYRESLALANLIGSAKQQIEAQIPLADALIGRNTNHAIYLLKKSVKLSIQINVKHQTLYAYQILH
ncbi:MAG: tetratricopeptide repeat protein, partial [Psychromonas sp.]